MFRDVITKLSETISDTNSVHQFIEAVVWLLNQKLPPIVYLASSSKLFPRYNQPYRFVLRIYSTSKLMNNVNPISTLKELQELREEENMLENHGVLSLRMTTLFFICHEQVS